MVERKFTPPAELLANGTNPEELLQTSMLASLTSVEVEKLCPHANVENIKTSLYIFCDPPSAVCKSCLTGKGFKFASSLIGRGFLWDHVCDACGAVVEALNTMNLELEYGSMLEGNVCDTCLGFRDSTPRILVDNFVPTPRNAPCYCNSGLKFKKCHGKHPTA